MNTKPNLSDIFSPSALRIVCNTHDGRSRVYPEIPFEIEPLEGSPIYHALPSFFRKMSTIHGFIKTNPSLDEQFVKNTNGEYGGRYIIFRESTSHYIVLFVSDDERFMHFFRYEKDEIVNLIVNGTIPPGK